MGQPGDSKWVAKWLQDVRPLYRPPPGFTPHPIGEMMSGMATRASPQKITFAEVRDTGVRALLILRRLPLQLLDRDQRRSMAGLSKALRS